MTFRFGSEDEVLAAITDYVISYEIVNGDAFDTVRWDLMDSLGTALLSLRYPECTKLLGPWVPGTSFELGARVPGTHYELDPIQAAFSFGTMVRWLDYNDAWLALEWGHPSDNLGAILPVADWVSRKNGARGTQPLYVKDVLTSMIKAHEIQGVLSLGTSLNRVGLDHVLFVKVASSALSAWLLGANRDEILNALSNAWIDSSSLRTYRHGSNTGSRKSWAAGDAASRGVRLAMMAVQGEMGYKTALSAPLWGFQDAVLKGNSVLLGRELGSYVMENVLFKVNYPAEFHAQTAVEAAITLYDEVKGRLDDIESIVIKTQESAMRIIDKVGELRNPADRDHCIQYMVAVALLEGTLTADHYQDEYAANPAIDKLRAKMTVVEEPQYSIDYLDPEKRSIANSLRIEFKDGSSTRELEVEYPVGHRRRRREAIPLLKKKFVANVSEILSHSRISQIQDIFEDLELLANMTVPEFVGLWIPT